MDTEHGGDKQKGARRDDRRKLHRLDRMADNGRDQDESVHSPRKPERRPDLAP